MTQSQPYRTEKEWIHAFTDLDAYWRHTGNPENPHALLTEGGHSDGFFNWNIVSQYPRLLQRTSSDLLRNLEKAESLTSAARSFRVRDIQRVIGPGYGAITLAHSLAEVLLTRNPECRDGFTEKMPDKSMSLERFVVAGENVIACEDTITSGASVSASIEAIERAGGKVSPFILCICNRSGLEKIGDRQIVSLINTPMHNWASSECPLCKKGSSAIRPKKDNNWSLLKGIS